MYDEGNQKFPKINWGDKSSICTKDEISLKSYIISPTTILNKINTYIRKALDDTQRPYLVQSWGKSKTYFNFIPI